MTTNVIGSGLSGGQAAVEDVEVGEQRAGQRAVRRLDDHQRDARHLALEVGSRSATASAWSSVMYTARMSSSIERATLMAWTTARFRPGIGTTTRSSRCGGRTTRSGADRQLARGAACTGG